MSWKVTLPSPDGDKSMLLDDLSPEDFASCSQHDNVNWLKLYTAPAVDPIAYYELLCVCALKLEVAAPARPRTVKDSVALLSYIDQVDDDLPTSFSEGGIPLEDPGETETTTSSTSTEPEDGPQSKPDDPQ